ncbi:MAG: hypothetical protein U0835_17315 [Isosphaeraceae bacterium]
MATKDPEKTVDVPPRGSRNPDPITNAPGSHPVETGIGAAAGGALSGMAVGAVAGPVTAAVGAALGAVAGGLAGKGVGELIDPTTEDNWLRDNYTSRPYYKKGDTFETHVPAYRYGAEAEAAYGDQPYETVEENLRTSWNPEERGGLSWDRANPAVRDAYERSCAIRKQRASKS